LRTQISQLSANYRKFDKKRIFPENLANLANFGANFGIFPANFGKFWQILGLQL